MNPGQHRLDVQKNGYTPFWTTVDVTEGQTTQVTAELDNTDEEQDDLLDYYERNGFIDGLGNWHSTDPDSPDTDGDGLSDGYETGYSTTDAYGRTYFIQRSDPTKSDTDDDGLDDYWENSYGTNPYDQDTDHDGVWDGDDSEPLIPMHARFATDWIRGEISLRLGAVFGETGLPDGIFYGRDLCGPRSLPYFSPASPPH